MHEQVLCQLFQDVLDVEKVNADDNFFDLGGQSIQAMRLLLMIESKIGPELTIDELFDAPTAAQLATRLDQLTQQST